MNKDVVEETGMKIVKDLSEFLWINLCVINVKMDTNGSIISVFLMTSMIHV